jgi:hypothetical protein
MLQQDSLDIVGPLTTVGLHNRRSTVVDHAFPVAAARARINLPPSLKEVDSTITFHQKLNISYSLHQLETRQFNKTTYEECT